MKHLLLELRGEACRSEYYLMLTPEMIEKALHKVQDYNDLITTGVKFQQVVFDFDDVLILRAFHTSFNPVNRAILEEFPDADDLGIDDLLDNLGHISFEFSGSLPKNLNSWCSILIGEDELGGPQISFEVEFSTGNPNDEPIESSTFTVESKVLRELMLNNTTS